MGRERERERQGATLLGSSISVLQSTPPAAGCENVLFWETRDVGWKKP